MQILFWLHDSSVFLQSNTHHSCSLLSTQKKKFLEWKCYKNFVEQENNPLQEKV